MQPINRGSKITSESNPKVSKGKKKSRAPREQKVALSGEETIKNITSASPPPLPKRSVTSRLGSGAASSSEAASSNTPGTRESIPERPLRAKSNILQTIQSLQKQGLTEGSVRIQGQNVPLQKPSTSPRPSRFEKNSPKAAAASSSSAQSSEKKSVPIASSSSAATQDIDSKNFPKLRVRQESHAGGMRALSESKKSVNDEVLRHPSAKGLEQIGRDLRDLMRGSLTGPDVDDALSSGISKLITAFRQGPTRGGTAKQVEYFNNLAKKELQVATQFFHQKTARDAIKKYKGKAVFPHAPINYSNLERTNFINRAIENHVTSEGPIALDAAGAQAIRVNLKNIINELLDTEDKYIAAMEIALQPRFAPEGEPPRTFFEQAEHKGFITSLQRYEWETKLGELVRDARAVREGLVRAEVNGNDDNLSASLRSIFEAYSPGAMYEISRSIGKMMLVLPAWTDLIVRIAANNAGNRQEDPLFAMFKAIDHENTGNTGRDLSNFPIMPVQRFPRIEMILKDIQRKLDKAGAADAAEAISQRVNCCLELGTRNNYNQIGT